MEFVREDRSCIFPSNPRTRMAGTLRMPRRAVLLLTILSATRTEADPAAVAAINTEFAFVGGQCVAPVRSVQFRDSPFQCRLACALDTSCVAIQITKMADKYMCEEHAVFQEAQGPCTAARCCCYEGMPPAGVESHGTVSVWASYTPSEPETESSTPYNVSLAPESNTPYNVSLAPENSTTNNISLAPGSSTTYNTSITPRSSARDDTSLALTVAFTGLGSCVILGISYWGMLQSRRRQVFIHTRTHAHIYKYLSISLYTYIYIYIYIYISLYIYIYIYIYTYIQPDAEALEAFSKTKLAFLT